MIRKTLDIVTSRKILAGAAALAVLMFAWIVFASVAPSDFPVKKIITIKEGATLTSIADVLYAEHAIKHPRIYKAYVTLLGGRRKVIAGDYLLKSPQSALTLAYRTINGIQDLKRIKVTIPEGIASHDVGRLLAKSIPGFDSEAFYNIGKIQEGYLFPETYYFYETVTPDQAIMQMRETFDVKTRGVLMAINLFGKTKDDVIKMASIVEKEATSTVDRRIIAGILWRRIDNKMPLQVDPPFFYYLGKKSLDLTLADLASDSPYNLYRHTGLPPTPINNPGLDAITDTINPTPTKYVFYLSDRYGNMHYAETHDEHLANKRKYIP